MTLLFLIIGIGFFLLGLRMILSNDKFWWWSKSTAAVPTNVVFAAFPATFLFFLMAYIFYYQFSLSTKVKDDLSFFVGIPLIIIAVVLSIWQPRWLKPKWLRWLEANHGSILPLLQEEARQEEWSTWQKKVETQEGLEAWVAEVREKNHL